MATDVQESQEEEKEPKDATGEPGPAPNLPFTHGFVASLSVIIVSEIGDKTFFIAAIMAMQHSRCMVCMGAILSLGECVCACMRACVCMCMRAYVCMYVCVCLCACDVYLMCTKSEGLVH